MIKYDSIKVAFENDIDIFNYSDPNIIFSDITDLVNNIYNKLFEYVELGNCYFEDFIYNGVVVGYVFTYKNLLVSFGVNKKFRNKKCLNIFFKFIVNLLGEEFYSYMWERNKRAIFWLKKLGMVEIESEITYSVKLKYSLCH